MKAKCLFPFILFIIICSNINGEPTRTDSIRNALLYQKSHYTASQYRDVYKNFMQDFYGPGHMISDKEKAGDNLLKEMNSLVSYDGPDYEPTGFKGNFVRVNLRLIAQGVVPYQTFLDAFVESVQAIIPPDPQFWLKTWNEIDKEISGIGWNFENEEEDRKSLQESFEQGNFVVHHSNAYNEAVNFHYRIVSKENFEKIILPFLQEDPRKNY